jgi:hypothetical protein
MKKMKKILLFILLIGVSSYSQNKEGIINSKLICKTIDEFTDKVDLDSNKTIFYKDGGDMRSEGLIVILILDEKKKKILKSTFLLVMVKGIKGCVDEGSTLDVIFENGEKSQLLSFNPFNCDGNVYFSLDNKEDLFKNNKIKAMKFTNKRDYETMVIKNNINKDNSSYLSNILLELDKINNGEVSIGVCKK